MSKLTDYIKQKQTKLEIMEGREKEDLKSLLEKEIHINDFDFLNGEDGTYAVFTIAEDEKYQGFMEQMLELITLWFKDVLLYKATLNDNLLLFKEDSFEIHEQASRCSYSGLNEIFDTISQTRARLNANVNFELTIMLLIESIKENTR